MFRRFPKKIRGFVVSTSQNYLTLGLKISETVSSGASLNRNDRLFQRRPHFLHKPSVNSVILFFILASIGSHRYLCALWIHKLSWTGRITRRTGSNGSQSTGGHGQNCSEDLICGNDRLLYDGQHCW